MAGTIQRDALIHKEDMRRGDCVVMTKAVAVEGTAIIAGKFGPHLQSKGICQEDIDESCRFANQMSIIPEARVAADYGYAVAMHDVTEGGLATAVEELSLAGGHRIAVYLDNIPIFEQTRKICRVLDLDPLGLIGSGSLLICCRPTKTEPMIQKLASQDIAATVIGKVLEPGEGITAFDHGQPASWPQFETDEITTLFNRAKAWI